MNIISQKSIHKKLSHPKQLNRTEFQAALKNDTHARLQQCFDSIPVLLH